jgi:hypothetical protein
MTLELMTLLALWCTGPEPDRYRYARQVETCRASVLKCIHKADVPVNKCFENAHLEASDERSR